VALILALVPTHLQAQARLDVSVWNSLLNAAVDKGQVDYAQWRDNPEFAALIEQIATTDTNSMDRQQQLAFYINTYNILAAQGILDGRSPDGLLGRYLYFKRDTYAVAGSQISLHELEHEWIRPLMEPRIHFAIVCASQSCPILQNEAYTAERLDEQLDAAARAFINDTARNRFDPVTGRAQLSSIFKWFEEDFVQAAGSVEAYLVPLVDNPEAAKLLENSGFNISYMDYDWSLNGTL
jgi:ABC-type transport system substrate-binding protein